MHNIPGKKQCQGSAERGDAVAQLGCHSSSWSPRDRVCDEGVRKQPPLIGNGDTQLAGMMVGGCSRWGRRSPHKQNTQIHMDAVTLDAKQLPHTYPQGLPRESEPRVHCARCLEQLDQGLKEANRMDGGGHGTYILNASHWHFKRVPFSFALFLPILPSLHYHLSCRTHKSSHCLFNWWKIIFFPTRIFFSSYSDTILKINKTKASCATL